VSVELLVTLWAGLAGLAVGSYLNVVAHRLPREESTLWPASHCPECGATIRPLDNIPLLSWILLRGRCRSCRTRISLRYPALEAATGLLFAACVVRFGVSWRAAFAALLAALLLTLMAIDLEHFLLPDWLTKPGIAAGLAGNFLLSGELLPFAFAAAAGAGIVLLLIGGWWLVRREQAMGYGDVKMLAMIGAFLGWPGTLLTLVVASTVGAAAGLVLIAFRGADGKTRLPFGVFLSLGALVALYFGEPLAHAYFGML
jgi:leader peptidase (prepilin peptidase)/N-methyltransferase